MEYLVIDVDSREIQIPGSVENLGVKDDDETKILYFRMPRFYEGIDFADYNAQVNYINASQQGDTYIVLDKKIETEITENEVDDEVMPASDDPDGEVFESTESSDYITFSWTVGGNAYHNEGEVMFLVYLWKPDPESPGKFKKWHTTWANLRVLPGGCIEDAGIDEKHLDIIEQLFELMKGIREDLDGIDDILDRINGEVI